MGTTRNALCDDCVHLTEGRALHGEPHQYLLNTGVNNPTRGHLYFCVLCLTTLLKDSEGAAQWVRLMI